MKTEFNMNKRINKRINKRMNKRIYIHMPNVLYSNSQFFGDAVRLVAMVDFVNEYGMVVRNKELYFDFSVEYKDFIDSGLSDAFVVGLLSSAMEYGYDICYEAPISKRLHYQLTNFYLPLIHFYNKDYPMNLISLIGPSIDIKNNSIGAVATGCSGGVDSFYTISKYKNNTVGFKLTHLVCSSSGTLDHNIERINKTFQKIFKYVQKIGQDSGLSVIGCYNNLYEFYKYPYKAFNTFFTTTFCSVPFALSKLISVYYVNSGMPAETFSLDITTNFENDCSVFDLFTVKNLCTDSLTFYSSGFEAISRNDKVSYISDDHLARKYLAVCGAEMDGADIPSNTLNCSRCKKCLRTMFSLYVINKLDNFGSTFDIEDFKNNLGKRIGAVLAYDHREFNDISLKIAQNNGINIPVSAFFYKSFVFTPLEFFRKVFRKVPFVKKVGYFFKIDYFMHGYRRGKN